MFTNKEIADVCHEFGITCTYVSNVIDTSHNEDDRRYNYNIDNNYFLKINNSKSVTEEFLKDILKLIKRYRSIGIYCPDLIKRNNDILSYNFIKDNIKYTCYMEEYVPYSFYKMNEQVDYEFKKKVVRHLGKLATMFTNLELSANKSMWSLIELGSFSSEIDEKQENLNLLFNTLQKEGYYEVSNRLISINKESRSRIQRNLNKLPRCIYQGDLNDSNILVNDKGEFKGIIDFNMFGTEVNINCFLNETMYYLTMEDFETLTGKEIFDKMERVQDGMMAEILEEYKLNSLEIEMLREYKMVIYMSFYPNVMLWIDLISKHNKSGKVIELLNMIFTI